MNPFCPYCGKALTPLELILVEHDESYQCHNCWNRIRATEAEKEKFEEELVGAGAGAHDGKVHGARHHRHGAGRKT